MNSKLRYPIRLDDGKMIYTIKDEKELFIMREENIRKKLYSTSAVKKRGFKSRVFLLLLWGRADMRG